MPQQFQNQVPQKQMNQNKGAAGMRASHEQMERNYHNDRDKADVKGESTPASKKRVSRDNG